ncbi:HK97 gp10 family phage protein [Paracoccus cavernae]|uniref:HK97 gp10 family phage protein n=2 Tax=Paracoccus cavernae TaxID=1571207 RepID=A0ABT8DAD0_9RHOB|nr:HK97 gp10 family phage protein [Paracoccus cavernae]
MPILGVLLMVNGIPQMQAMFRRKAKAVIAAARTSAKQGGDEVADAVRYLAPRDQGELVASVRVEQADTVKTRKGDREFIGVIVKAGDASTTISNDAGEIFQNARIQEFGTKNMPANPFFFPAWRLNRARIRSRISGSVSKAWKNG